eukprot:TRINITY_DN65862_c11_g1_i1.p2 TRINITY_DN65862_c11_g1~~TRINITY_DN65862_c11_g1_i1.p2  ORF type:complete len:355 (-),score=229.43 TRINITY_DN65862_c11_g1_i1:55-1119(-)
MGKKGRRVRAESESDSDGMDFDPAEIAAVESNFLEQLAKEQQAEADASSDGDKTSTEKKKNKSKSVSFDAQVDEAEKNKSKNKNKKHSKNNNNSSPFGKPAVNNVVALEQKEDEVALPDEWSWVETLAVTSSEPLELDNVDDDLKREALFYQQALRNATTALVQLDHLGVPHRRPADFFVEMVKTDQHMIRVKEALLTERKRMDIVEERRRAQEARKFARQVQVSKEQEKARRKKVQIEALNQWKKTRKKNQANVADGGGVLPRADMDDALQEAINNPERVAERGRQEKAAERKANRKRLKRNAKYGYGGPRKRQKQNDAESSANYGFEKTKNSKKKKNNKNRRPGKAARQQRR